MEYKRTLALGTSDRLCLWCNGPVYDNNRNGIKKLYCTRQHKRNALKSRLRGNPMRREVSRICAICKNLVPQSRNINALFCSKKCLRIHTRRGDPFYYNIFQPRICKDCGAGFETLFPTQEHCTTCQKLEIRNRHTHSRRCRKYGVPFELFSILGIFIRDGWICRICNLPAPKELRGSTNSLAPELDHIIPLSMGPGISPGHVLSNCQCAHRKCNYSKNLSKNPIIFEKSS